MRVFTLYSFVALFLAHLSLAFQLPFQQALSQLFTTGSPLPQFILDTEHSWLKGNSGYLEHLENPTQALCSLDSKLRPGNGAGKHQYPPDLFSSLFVNNNKAGVSRPGWKNAGLRLREMLDCPAALNDVQSFSVNTWISDGSFGIGYPEPPKPPKELPGLFVEALASMPNLQKLEWNTFGNGNEDFQQAFTKANLTLPSVRHLIPAMFTDFLVAMCPGVEHLHSGQSISTASYWRWASEGDARDQLVQSTRQLKNLTIFGMEGEWEIKYLEGLLEASPNITTLKMGGEIASRFYSDSSDDQLLKNYVEILARFPRLEHLHLPHSSELGLGFDGGHWCGNAYEGEGGRAYGRSVAREGAETTERAAQIVLDQLPDLKTLFIGSDRANITRNEHNGVNATFPWSGRIEGWTYEVWPETKEDL